MRYAQRITKSSLGLLLSRSGNKQKKLGSSKVNIRIKKDLMKHGECVLHKVFISYLVLGFLRISFIALFRRLQDRLGCPISIQIIPTRSWLTRPIQFCKADLTQAICGAFIIRQILAIGFFVAMALPQAICIIARIRILSISIMHYYLIYRITYHQ